MPVMAMLEHCGTSVDLVVDRPVPTSEGLEWRYWGGGRLRGKVTLSMQPTFCRVW